MQRDYFESVYARYHRAEYLHADPLLRVYAFSDDADREIAALVSALLAYGNVAQIKKSLDRLFSRLGPYPSQVLLHASFGELQRLLRSFRHRFQTGDDIAALLWLMGQTQREFGCLEQAFLTFDEGSDYATMVEGITSLWGEWCLRDKRLTRVAQSRSFRHLVSTPSRASACKRWFLFLRWVVRPRDGVDLGLWKNASPSKLLFPVDRHILRIANNLGIVRSCQATLRIAREITDFFRRIDPMDPVRFDFALCHLGILGVCPTKPDMDACRRCELTPVCCLRRKLECLS